MLERKAFGNTAEKGGNEFVPFLSIFIPCQGQRAKVFVFTVHLFIFLTVCSFIYLCRSICLIKHDETLHLYSLWQSADTILFMHPNWKIRGILFYRCASVCLCVCLSVCLSVRPLSVCTHLTWKLNIFPLFLNWYSYKAHIWYEGTSNPCTSPCTKVKVICKGKSQISGSWFSKDRCFRGTSVSQTHLVYFTTFECF